MSEIKVDDTHYRGVLIDYTNYRGERSERRVIPIDIEFGHNEWHPEDQWLMRALDVQKRATRTFAMKDIHGWRVPPP